MTTKSFLSPEDPFPADVQNLPDARLHVLNSLVHRQLEREYVEAGGPNPETEFRLEELRIELDRREAACGPALSIPASSPRRGAPLPA
ncbi:hypothetical protein AAIH25_17190 [Arthrobacter crystallopoietes]|uniref:hypothetical protein n=1 Tax=Micrococcaceae TaxID=1268 RepID=UPI0021C58843|nr:hypothetical protein [Arthrobacter sp. Marseille-P9274]